MLSQVNCLHFLLVLVVFFFQFGLQQVKCTLSLIQIWWLTLPSQTRTFLAFAFVRSWVPSNVSIYTVKCHPMCFEAFGWVWADIIDLYTLIYYRIHPAAFTCSNIINTYKVTMATGTRTHLYRKIRWYGFFRKQFLLFSTLFSAHHAGTSWYFPHLSIGFWL